MNKSQFIVALRGALWVNHAAADQRHCSYCCNIPEGEGSLDSSSTTLFAISSAVCRKYVRYLHMYAKEKLQCVLWISTTQGTVYSEQSKKKAIVKHMQYLISNNDDESCIEKK